MQDILYFEKGLFSVQFFHSFLDLRSLTAGSYYPLFIQALGSSPQDVLTFMDRNRLSEGFSYRVLLYGIHALQVLGA